MADRLLTSRLFSLGCHVLRHPKTGESWFAVARTAFETRKGGIYFSTLEAGAEVQPTYTAERKRSYWLRYSDFVR